MGKPSKRRSTKTSSGRRRGKAHNSGKRLQHKLRQNNQTDVHGFPRVRDSWVDDLRFVAVAAPLPKPTNVEEPQPETNQVTTTTAVPHDHSHEHPAAAQPGQFGRLDFGVRPQICRYLDDDDLENDDDDDDDDEDSSDDDDEGDDDHDESSPALFMALGPRGQATGTLTSTPTPLTTSEPNAAPSTLTPHHDHSHGHQDHGHDHSHDHNHAHPVAQPGQFGRLDFGTRPQVCRYLDETDLLENDDDGSEDEDESDSETDAPQFFMSLGPRGQPSASSASALVNSDNKNNQTTATPPPPTSSIPTPTKQPTVSPTSPSLTVVSWNILARSYCSPRSHVKLPSSYQAVVFEQPRREQRLRQLLHQLAHVPRSNTTNTASTSNNTNNASTDPSLTADASAETSAETSAAPTTVDVFCLQEVDMLLVQQELEQLGYVAVESPRVAQGRGGSGCRIDSCGIYVQSARWRVVDSQIVQLDELATLSENKSVIKTAKTTTTTTRKTKQALQKSKTATTKASPPKPISSETLASTLWQGLQSSFLRRNVAVVVRLRAVAPPHRTVVVANAHLFWNPGYEFVKLMQLHYVARCVHQFCKPNEPVILAGDWNSKPRGCAHTYVSNGHINAKLVAPWYAYHHFGVDEEEEVDNTEDEENGSDDGVDEEDDSKEDDNDDDDCGEARTKGSDKATAENAESDRTKEETPESKGKPVATKSISEGLPFVPAATTANLDDGPPPMRYYLDATLNKLCRWLRILGQDVALETEEEEKQRTKQNKMVIFDRCRAERRTLVTTSVRLVQRRDCPAGTYCINPSILPNLEVAMVHILLTHGVVLNGPDILTRCVVCNGKILPVAENERKRTILQTYDAPVEIGDNLEVFECDKCGQGYWWDDRPSSSASRVKSTATRLVTLCLQAGIPLGGDLDREFKHIDIAAEQAKGWDFSLPGSDLLRQKLDVIDWLKDENLTCPFELESAYRDDDVDNHRNRPYLPQQTDNSGEEPDPLGSGERIPFTNVTARFVSTLDYIFYPPKQMVLQERLHVPTSFHELNDQGKGRGHLLPSDVWPSDHLAIGASFQFVEEKKKEVNIVSNASNPATMIPVRSTMELTKVTTTSASSLPVPVPAATESTKEVPVSKTKHQTKAPSKPQVDDGESTKTSTMRNTATAIKTTKGAKPAVSSTPLPAPTPSTPFPPANSPMALLQRLHGVAPAPVGRELPPANTPMAMLQRLQGATPPAPVTPLTAAAVCPTGTHEAGNPSCNCIPPIPSLFEMAARRKQYRKQQQLEKERLLQLQKQQGGT